MSPHRRPRQEHGPLASRRPKRLLEPSSRVGNKGPNKTYRYTIGGDGRVTVRCDPKGGMVKVNSDAGVCFMYGGASGLPATPFETPCVPS